MKNIYIHKDKKGEMVEIPKKLYKEVNKLFPNFFDLLLETESMNDDEKVYWLDILPSLSNIQILEREKILYDEKQKINIADIKYKKECEGIYKKSHQLTKEFNETHLKKWKEK